MKRCGQIAMLALVGTVCAGVSLAQAQPAGPSGDERFSAEFTAGPTLGHKSASVFAVQGTWQFMPKLDIFVEGGHMVNVGTSRLDDSANVIAGFISSATGQPATVTSTGISVNHFDVGVKYWIDPIRPKLHPYIVAALGPAWA